MIADLDLDYEMLIIELSMPRTCAVIRYVANVMLKILKPLFEKKKNWWLMVSVRCGSVRVPPFDMLKLFMAIQ